MSSERDIFARRSRSSALAPNLVAQSGPGRGIQIVTGSSAVGLDGSFIVSSEKKCMWNARHNGWIEVCCSFVRRRGLPEQAAKAKHLHQTCEAFRLTGMTLDPREQSRQRAARLADVRLHRSVELVGAGEIRIDKERSPEGSIREFNVSRGVATELPEKPAASAEPGPCRAKVGSSARHSQYNSRARVIDSSDRCEVSSFARANVS